MFENGVLLLKEILQFICIHHFQIDIFLTIKVYVIQHLKIRTTSNEPNRFKNKMGKLIISV